MNISMVPTQYMHLSLYFTVKASILRTMGLFSLFMLKRFGRIVLSRYLDTWKTENRKYGTSDRNSLGVMRKQIARIRYKTFSSFIRVYGFNLEDEFAELELELLCW